MLSDAPARAALPAADLERAKAFYADKCGLHPADENPAGAFYDCGGGSRFMLFSSAGSASGTHTQISFQVENIEGEVAELASKGVVFEEYDFPTMKTVKGIADVGLGRAAWFRDSEGNLIGVFESSD